MEDIDKECRKEGAEAFVSNPYDINRNPYGILTSEEESEKRHQWQYGWEDAHREADRMDEV